MRKAWYEAIKRKDYDYFWLVNDDTHIFPNCLTELLKADRYTIEQYKKQGIYIGATQDEHNKKTTYGGHKLQKWGKQTQLCCNHTMAYIKYVNWVMLTLCLYPE